MWGTCANGTEAVGCGKPETFRNCADVSITTSTGGGLPPEFASAENPYLLFVRDLRAPNYVFPLVIRCVRTDCECRIGPDRPPGGLASRTSNLLKASN